MRTSTRPPVLGALVGVLLLVGVVVFAVGLPEWRSAEGAEGSSGSVELPAVLAGPEGDFLVLDDADLPEALVQQFGGAERIREQSDSAGERVGELFGGEADFELYAKADGSALIALAVAEGEPGLFLPDGPPFDSSEEVARPLLQVERVGDAVCSVTWREAVPAGQEPDPAEKPAGVHCQLGVDGRTYDVNGSGLSVEETTALLDLAASA